MVEQLTKASYDAFVRGRPFAAVHFDGEWDVGGRPNTRLSMAAARELPELEGLVQFGEVDIDAEVELARDLPVGNVPLVAYYRDGLLVATLVGTGQNVAERLRRLMRGEPIGYRDGTSTPFPPKPWALY